MIVGLDLSFAHAQNGMTRPDMEATMVVADKFKEVIIFRSTGPWSKRWLRRGYPSKNFHVKGKSSDWGPHAGLVPFDGTYSKVGYDLAKAAEGTNKNREGEASGFAGRQALRLSAAQIDEQLTVPEGQPPRNAIATREAVPDSNDLILRCRRSGDEKLVVFRAVHRGGDQFEIKVYPPDDPIAVNPLQLDADGSRARVFEVMTSREVGADMPMTGDYDLFSVCPSWAQYGSSSGQVIEKAAIELIGGPGHGHAPPQGLSFAAGTGMDKVLDPRLHTMSAAGDYALRRGAAQARANLEGPDAQAIEAAKRVRLGHADPSGEHGDMGNLTPRILRCINELNVQMGVRTPAMAHPALRRVHHNAESHRFRNFGALTERDMLTIKAGETYGDGFPLTVFQPSALGAMRHRDGSAMAIAGYGPVCTLETLAEFRQYATALIEAGYYVPKNWIWG